ncbi:hypothetical protein DWQ65_10640 [Treponema phagedenis]|uniref:Outer membrane protein beta-barrel domain-containing protein n=1 Tax=Treponema phagedenis TaxID=162 RepID=A0A0B7GWZ6_TREPH|nr:hypothetical protein [Treponema phagedenis]QSI00504.1 hypothetical protein DWQ65_10640 [Treponema phagedenis]CEM62087.1 conserved exported hypothetical protein [Treponema phagedenis]
MKRIFFVLIVCFLCFTNLFSEEISEQETTVQTEPADDTANKKDSSALDKKDEKPESIAVYEPIRKGDQYMKLGITVGFPLFNTSPEKFAVNPKIHPGGGFFLGYAYYLTKGFSLGGEVEFQFYPTLGKNLYFSVPIVFNIGYTFAKNRLRFPLSFGIGGNFQACNATKYFAMLFKPAVGFYYQYLPEWSFGGDIAWNVIPQWYKEKKYNRTGNFLTISIGARYHF